MEPSKDNRSNITAIGIIVHVCSSLTMICLALTMVYQGDNIRNTIRSMQNHPTATPVPVETNPLPAYTRDGGLPIIPGTTILCQAEDQSKRCSIFGPDDQQIHQLTDEVIDLAAQTSPFWDVDRSALMKSFRFQGQIHYADWVTERTATPVVKTTPANEKYPPGIPGVLLVCPDKTPGICYVYDSWMPNPEGHIEEDVFEADVASSWDWNDDCPPDAKQYQPKLWICLGTWRI